MAPKSEIDTLRKELRPLAGMNTNSLAVEVVNALQHMAEALECVAATLPADRRATVEKHAVELRRSKTGIMAELDVVSARFNSR